MIKNSKGNSILSFLLLSLTLIGIVTITMDFLKLNRQVLQISTMSEAKQFLLNDILRQIRIPASLRNSANESSNSVLRNCILTSVSCPSLPTGFVLISPVVYDPLLPIAGTESNPILYNRLGELCLPGQLDCTYKAYAFYLVNLGEIKIWVYIQNKSSISPPVVDSANPHFKMPISKITKFNY